MTGKFLLKIRTALALRLNKTKRVSDAYKKAKNIGLLYSYDAQRSPESINDLIAKFESDGKKVAVMIFIPSTINNVVSKHTFFRENDLNSTRKLEKGGVREFKNEAFDFLLNIDLNVNKYTENILASTRAKCRVGRYEESKNKYFELMIKTADDIYEFYIKQVYHYLKNIRNE